MKKGIIALGAFVVTVAVIIVSFTAGYYFAGDTEYSGKGLDKVTEAWNIIADEYVEKGELDEDKLAEGAIEGLMDALDDPHSAYLDQEAYQLNIESSEGKYEGIGAAVAMQEEEAIVLAVYPDSPAEKGGLKVGDIILAVNGVSVEGMSLEEMIVKVRGEIGTELTMSVKRGEQGETVELSMVRGEIKVPSVFSEMIGNVAYIEINRFTERTDSELMPIIRDLEANGAEAIILDLRSNPGGTLNAVIDVTSRFITEGVVLSVVDSEGSEEIYETVKHSITTDLPMIILVNEYSASASEVLSGALKDHGRAVIAGKTTYGKGSVNLLFPLADGSGIYLTISRWYTPNGVLIEGNGVTPDIMQELEGEELLNWAVDYIKP